MALVTDDKACCIKLKTATYISMMLSFLWSLGYILTTLIDLSNTSKTTFYDPTYMFIVVAIFYLVCLVTSGLGVYAIKEHKVNLLFPFVVAYAIVVGYNLVTWILQFIQVWRNPEAFADISLALVALKIVAAVIMVFIVHVVRHYYYTQLKSVDHLNDMEENPQNPPNQSKTQHTHLQHPQSENL